MLYKKITADYIQAMKNKETEKAAALNFLRAQIKNVMIDKRVEELDDADVIAVIKKQVKQRQESIAQFQKGGRTDLAEKEQREMEILKAYLPEEMSEEELLPVVRQVVKETGVTGIKDMGMVMKALMPKVGGKADNKVVSDVVRKILGSL
ncbi:MAG: GatB/YqeY domain-containing protein [Candidatus Omnitrophota bacterium]